VGVCAPIVRQSPPTPPAPATHRTHPQDLFELVGQHFAARAAISGIDGQLEQQEVTFRSIQKRLLARYKVGAARAAAWAGPCRGGRAECG
jgi:hypothetical protein